MSRNFFFTNFKKIANRITTRTQWMSDMGGGEGGKKILRVILPYYEL